MDQKNPTSKSYLLAVEDTDFLLRDEMRAIRFALEYAKPELALRDWGIRSTIIVFGSARTPSPEQAEAAIAAAQSAEEKQRAGGKDQYRCKAHTAPCLLPKQRFHVSPLRERIETRKSGTPEGGCALLQRKKRGQPGR